MPLKGSCHCGATQFEVTAAPTEVTECNCSICFRRGQKHAYYEAAEFKLLTARDRVATYQFGHYVGQHHHCPVCGCGTYSEFPDFSSGQPNFERMKVSVNARLFDVESFDLDAVPVKRVNGRTDW